MGKKPEGKIGKNSNKSSDRTQAVLRTEMLPCFPELDRKRQIELMYRLPFSLKITLGLGLWLLFTSYWRHQLSTELREFCLLGRPLSRQLSPPQDCPSPICLPEQQEQQQREHRRQGVHVNRGEGPPFPAEVNIWRDLGFREGFRLSHV